MQVASIIPSSKQLIRKVADKMDHSAPRVIAEFGPGEGCHTREIVRRMHPDSHLLLFELDAELAEHLREQFAQEPRVTVLNTNALELSEVLASRGLSHCDYIVSGIPFSILEKSQKRELLRKTHEALAPAPHAAFIIYQVTNELRENGHCAHFARAESEYCLQNIPPMFVTKFYKIANGHSGNGHHANGAKGTDRMAMGGTEPNSQSFIALAARSEEIARCFDVMRELRPHLQNVEEFTERVQRQQSDGYRLAFLEQTGTVRAVAGFRVGENLAWGRFLYVDDLVTREVDRSLGFGRHLLAWLAQQAEADGCAQIHLDSGVQRFGAHRFYHAAGMTITSHHFAKTLPNS